MIKIVFTIAAAALSTSAIMLSPAAYAADAKVTWAGLNLSSEAGRHELARRVDVAARQACPDELPTGSRIGSRSVQECRSHVRAQVAERLNPGERVAAAN